MIMTCNPETINVATATLPSLPEGVPPLLSFYLYLTTGCNLRCRHCWITPTFVDGQPAPGEFLDLALLRRAVAEAKPLGLQSVKLTGGEPLLHPQFTAITDFLTAEGLEMDMETNGTLLDSALARHLHDHTRLISISVSIDGPDAEVHDPFRGVAGSFDAALRGLRCLVEAGYRPQVIMSIHRGNVERIEEVVELAVRLGAGSVKFNPVTPTGRGQGMQERGETFDPEEVLELAHFVRGELQQRTPIRLILCTPLALYTAAELARRGPDGACHVRHILGILGSGEMALCGIGRTIPELCFGNLRDASVAEVWYNHPMLRRLRRELDEEYPGICGRCIHAPRCLTYCPALNYQDSGRLISPSWLCAEAAARGQFPASRLRG